MLQPTPALPGEYYHGHLERIHLFNGLRSRRDTYHCLESIADANSHGEWRNNPAVRLSLLAAFDNAPVLDYCLEHTPLQYRLFCRTPHRSRIKANSANASSRAGRGQVDPNARIYMCRKCAIRDRGRAGPGYPYLRVAHQLPGVRWCTTHFEGLVECDLLCQPIDVGGARFDIANVTPLMGRFAEISVFMLKRAPSICPGEFCRAIRLRARQLGLKFNGELGGERNFLSNRIADQVDESWIEEIFPGYIKRLRSAMFSQIDGAMLRATNSTTAFALTLAYIYPTTKEALGGIREMRAPTREPFNLLEKEEVYGAYVRNMGNLKAMSAELGWRHSSLAHITGYILPSLHRNSFIAPAVRDVIYRKFPVEAAARRHGVSAPRLAYLINRGGALLRAAIKEIDRGLSVSSEV